MTTFQLLERIDFLILQGQQSLTTQYQGATGNHYVNTGKFFGFRSASLSFISRVLGENDLYYREFNNVCKDHFYHQNEAGINMLLALRDEIAAGWLLSFKQLVAAELFADFLEMSKYLLDEGYKDAAAVMIGSTLEEHLRQLCINHNLETHHLSKGDNISKKASVINADLKKANVYGPIEEKQIIAWLGIRNSAAHGKYADYTKEQIDFMHQGVLDFIAKVKS